jgi:hypothetical protein
MKCAVCGNEIHGFGNNGRPLVEGKVCDDCNWKVIAERLNLSKKQKEQKSKEANESVGLGELDGVVVGSGGPVNVTNPMEDFENYAKQFEDTFILGKTPVRKERPQNKVKVKDGELVGEVEALDKKQLDSAQVEPTKSATEALYGFSQIYEFLKLAKEMGITDFSDLEKFAQENPTNTIENFRKYREEFLGNDWENKDLTVEDKDEIRHLRAKQKLSEPI